jgi:hypothetical protein
MTHGAGATTMSKGQDNSSSLMARTYYFGTIFGSFTGRYA